MGISNIMAPQSNKVRANPPLARTSEPPLSGIASRIFQRGEAALEMLLESAAFAEDLGRDLWDFALEIETLRYGGIVHSDLRWLVCKGYLEKATEVLSSSQEVRCFERGGALVFTQASCFVITEAGKLFVQQMSEPISGPAALECSGSVNGHAWPQAMTAPAVANALRPCWDRDRQELRLGSVVVKQFKVPARNQEMVLAVFHEEGWPVRIDDPLPPHPPLEPKRRLHDTINSLNRNQKTPLLRFLGDGAGQGVRWEFTDPVDALQRD